MPILVPRSIVPSSLGAYLTGPLSSPWVTFTYASENNEPSRVMRAPDCSSQPAITVVKTVRCQPNDP